jgi:NTP pyrophosphatase (non-canonical NTP hydrolase)
MEVKELQRRVMQHAAAWDKYRGRKRDEQVSFNHLVEEVGELAHQYVSRDLGRQDYSIEEVENAIGDSLFHLIVLAEINGWKIEDILTKIIKNDVPGGKP